MTDQEAAEYCIEILRSHKAYFKTEVYRMIEYMGHVGVLDGYYVWKDGDGRRIEPPAAM